MTASPLTARFPLLDRPVAVPGACMCCNKGSVRVFDTRRNFFQFGAAYICEECITEMAHTLGMVSAELVSAAEDGAKQSILSILHQLNLRVVSDDLYNHVHGGISDLSVRFSDSDDSVFRVLGGKTVEDFSGDLEDSVSEPIVVDKPKRGKRAETDSNSGDKGPAGVPSSTSDGDDPFAL